MVRNGGIEEKQREELEPSAFYPIYVCESGRKMGWQVKLGHETSLISYAFPALCLCASQMEFLQLEMSAGIGTL